MLSKKDIIIINQQFSSGRVVNEGSLDYAIDTVRKSGNWLKTAAIICRAVLIDHVFEDGNKRTAAAAMLACAEISGVMLNMDKINKAIVLMMKNNTTEIKTIERMIKDAIE
jgi:prophage maintenance system killer protein